ncbi:hypothetical protein [Pyruvatibacter mobilis]|uniref:hypothetical protein n=1 Tax=Pyruvatibacter mobilis TaxID=1712261 RepID=UPI003BA87F74
MAAGLVVAVHHHDAGIGLAEQGIGEGHADSAGAEDEVIGFKLRGGHGAAPGVNVITVLCSV